MPQPLKSLEEVSLLKVSGGGDFSLLLSNESMLYTMGRNQFGQLGIGDRNIIQMNPTHLNLEIEIFDISAGSEHSLVLTKNNSLIAFGRNDYGQLGRGYLEFEFGLPQLVSLTVPPPLFVIQIAAGGYHSLAVLSNGSLYLWVEIRMDS